MDFAEILTDEKLGVIVYNPEHTFSTMQHHAGSNMLWGMLLLSRLGKLLRIDGKFGYFISIKF